MAAEDVRAVLADAPHGSLLTMPNAPASLVAANECEGSKFHNPRPMVAHPVNLASIFEPPEHIGQHDVVYLCGTCRDNLQAYLAVRDSYDGQTPGATRRWFGNLIRDLGDRAWDHYAAVRSGGTTNG